MTAPAQADLAAPVSASRSLVAAALSTVYLVWGSTYLAIRVVDRDMPPLLSAGVRFSVAGAVLLTVLGVRRGWSRLRLRPAQLGAVVLLGVLLPALGNGLVVVGERTVRSGVAALLVAAVPLWIVGWRTLSGDRPRRATMVGVVAGLAGLVVLLLPAGDRGRAGITGLAAILLATLAWSGGSVLAVRLPLPGDPFVAAAYEMLTGGLVLLGGATALGEPRELHPAAIGATSWLALTYLIVFGSLVAFTAYVWLLGNASVSLVSTYAYVNPVVAVLLGAGILGEPLGPGLVLGGGIVLAGVVLVVTGERRSRLVS